MYQFCDGPPLEPPAALGPDSLLWRWAGDSRISLLGGTIGLLQLMHPGIGAGVMQHSNFFADPLGRVFRSLPPILGAVYDGPKAPDTGEWVRDQHKTIKGTDAQGRTYHALHPDTYWWAHATFQFMAEQVADRFDNHRLTPLERERLYVEGIRWYRHYGVSDRPVPSTRASFQLEWDRVCIEDLEMNDAVRFVLDLIDKPMRLPLDGPLRRLRPIVRANPVAQLLAAPARLAAVGGLPRRVRERFEIPWSRADQIELDAIELAVRKAWRLVPFNVKWQPRAAEGWRRVRAEARGEAWPVAS